MQVNNNYNYSKTTYGLSLSGATLLATGLAIGALSACHYFSVAALYGALGGVGVGGTLLLTGIYQVVQEAKIAQRTLTKQKEEQRVALQESERISLQNCQAARAHAAQDAEKMKLAAQQEADRVKAQAAKEIEASQREIQGLNAQKPLLRQEIATLRERREEEYRESLLKTPGPRGVSPQMQARAFLPLKTLYAEAADKGDVILLTKDGKEVRVHSLIIESYAYLNLFKMRRDLQLAPTVEVPLNERETHLLLRFLYLGELNPLTIEEGCHLFAFASMARFEELQEEVKARLSYLFNRDYSSIIPAYLYLFKISSGIPDLEKFILHHFFQHLDKKLPWTTEPFSQFMRLLSQGTEMWHKLGLALTQAPALQREIIETGVKLDYLPAFILAAGLKIGNNPLTVLRERIDKGMREGDDRLMYGMALFEIVHSCLTSQEALYYLHQAAHVNYPSALCVLGKLYRHGWGECTGTLITLPKDFEKSLHFSEAGMKLGDLTCLLNLGILYETASGVPRNMKKAFELYEEIARGPSLTSGVPRAQFFLAQIYAAPEKFDNVVPKNLDTARMWCLKAADQGCEEAKKFLETLVN